MVRGSLRGRDLSIDLYPLTRRARARRPLPASGARFDTAIAEAPNECFNPAESNSFRRKPPPMLDTPKASEKSHAAGKILSGITDGVGVITFSNPAKRNAMSLE